MDIRSGSLTYGQWVGVSLSDSNRKSIYIPPGFAHGFCVVSPEAEVIYKTTEEYAPTTSTASGGTTRRSGLPGRLPVQTSRSETSTGRRSRSRRRTGVQTRAALAAQA